MNVGESVRFAIDGVTSNKMRSALTTLGILIGVAAVIILVAVGTGSSQAIQDQITRLGSNVLTVTSSSTAAGGRGGNAFGGGFRPGGSSTSVQSGTRIRAPHLTMEDAAALADKTQAPDIQGVAPVVSASQVKATFEGASHTVSTFTGTTPAYLVIDNYSLATGGAFTDDQYNAHQRVAVVGVTVAKDLAGGDGTGLLDKIVQFNGKDFLVLGILAGKGSTGPQDQDDLVVAPATSVQDALTGYGDLSQIRVKATSAATTTAAQNEVQAILDARHGTDSSNRDYNVQNQSQFVTAATSSSETFTVLLGAVAAISLLVGGIGVMNIMLVSVTERTHEIGIRKAIGAGKGDIIVQFLLEATLLSLFGALLGVLVGIAGSQFTIIGIKPVVAPYSVVLAFGVAIATGLFFGLYPASRAANLRPIDALRYE